MAKMLLPFHGGTYLVWGASVVFFQAVLFFGYAFSHTVIQKIGIKQYRYIHLCLLVLPLIGFPGRAVSIPTLPDKVPLVFQIFCQLSASIGLVFFVLSTMSIVWQVWLSASKRFEKYDVYALFAVSNLGSFAALLTYPFLVELIWSLPQQELLWRGIYFAIIIFNLISYRLVSVELPLLSDKTDQVSLERLGTENIVKIMIFSASGVILFLAITNITTIIIAPIPLFWIIPLSIYLLSFVFNFKQKPWCPRWIEGGISYALGFSMLLYFIMQKFVLPFSLESGLLLLCLFYLCMYTQRQLYRIRPASKSGLTAFYFYNALGSLLAGIITIWVVPIVANSLIEFNLGLAMVAGGILLSHKNQKLGVRQIRFIFYTIFILFVWPMAFERYNFFAMTGVVALMMVLFAEYQKSSVALGLCFCLILMCSGMIEEKWAPGRYRLLKRNYYGLYRVLETKKVRYFFHGTTIHGMEFLEEAKRGFPLAYYSIKSPIGEFLLSSTRTFPQIAMQGMGAGSLASFAKDQTTIDFYELDPDVYAIAREHFYFLQKTKAKVNVIFGDARIKLRQAKKKYDLIVSDVYSGDSVPAHMITREALIEYKERLKENGAILFHISNSFIEHAYVLCSTANSLDAHVYYRDMQELNRLILGSTWIMVTWDPTISEDVAMGSKWKLITKDMTRRFRVWTDQYSTMTPYIKWASLLEGLTKFKFFENR